MVEQTAETNTVDEGAETNMPTHCPSPQESWNTFTLTAWPLTCNKMHVDINLHLDLLPSAVVTITVPRVTSFFKKSYQSKAISAFVMCCYITLV